MHFVRYWTVHGILSFPCLNHDSVGLVHGLHSALLVRFDVRRTERADPDAVHVIVNALFKVHTYRGHNRLCAAATRRESAQ